jgi:hypothetical protein
MSDYTVILGDLKAMAGTFDKEATALEKLSGRVAPAPAKSGDGTLDETISDLLLVFGSLCGSVSTAIAGHGAKLKACHDNYHRNEADVAELYDTMLDKLS